MLGAGEIILGISLLLGVWAAIKRSNDEVKSNQEYAALQEHEVAERAKEQQAYVLKAAAFKEKHPKFVNGMDYEKISWYAGPEPEEGFGDQWLKKKHSEDELQATRCQTYPSYSRQSWVVDCEYELLNGQTEFEKRQVRIYINSKKIVDTKECLLKRGGAYEPDTCPIVGWDEER